MAVVNNILAAIDTSAMADEVLKRAISLAQRMNAQVTLLHSIDIPLVEKIFGGINGEKALKKRLEAKMDALNTQNPVDYFVTITRGRASDEIVYEAERLKSDLIIIGAHGKQTIADTFFGSTAHNVAQKSHLPVLIVKTAVTGEYRDILALTDLSEPSKESIRFTQKLFPEAEINITYAYTQISDLHVDFYNLEGSKESYTEQVREDVERDVEAFQQSLGMDNAEVIEGFEPVDEMLLEAATEHKNDLVILGTHGVRVSDNIFYGSTASYLMKKVPSDVLIYVPLAK